MRRRDSIPLSVAATVVGIVALLSLGSTPASAAETPAITPTATSFVGSTVVRTGFGGDWVLRVKVTGDAGPVTRKDGTVDVTVQGMSGNYAEGLPISGDGDVYLSPPAGKPALGAGTHRLTAYFRPAASSGRAASHTDSTATVTVSALTTKGSAAMSGVAKLAPKVTVSLAGAWQETTKSSPPGSWAIDVTNGQGKTAFSTSITQPTAGTEPIVVPITARLDRGADYTVTAVFSPTGAVSAGLKVAQAAPVTFRTPDLQVSEVVSRPVDVQIVFVVLGIAVIPGLVFAIVLVSRRSRRLVGSEA